MSTPRSGDTLHGMAISDTAIRQPVFISMMMLLAVVVGLLSYSALPVNYFPEISVPVVAVVVSYSGAGPESVAEQVTDPIEQSVNTISGVKKITSTSSEGTSQVLIQFEDSVDTDRALEDVREKVNGVLPSLSDDVGTPTYFKFDPNSLPVLQLAVAGDGTMTPLELRNLIDDTFVPALQRVSGVGSVDVSGGAERQINVQLDLDRLQAYALTPAQVSAAISDANTNQGLGSIDSDGKSYNLRVPTNLQTAEDIAAVPISGTSYAVGDVATVTDATKEATSYARLDGKDAVTLSIVKQTNTNTVSVAEGSLKVLEQLFTQYPQLSHVITSDQSEQVNESVSSSIEEIILSVLAAFLVVLLFFRDLRNTIVTMAGLPIILIFTFTGLRLFGITINVISLLALSLSVGLVIDDAIVVRENIFRYLERGYSPAQAASRATAEVSLSVLAMTLTIIAVFLPVAMVSGITGMIFKSFGLTVAIAMAISLVEAFTFAPMLSAHLFKDRHQPPPAEEAAEAPQEHSAIDEHEEMGALSRWYERILHWGLVHRFAVVGIAVAFLVFSIFVAAGMTLNFLPSQASDTISVAYTMEPGTALEETDKLARQGEQIIMGTADVTAVQSQVNADSGSFTVRVKDEHATDAVREQLRQSLAFLPDLTLGAQSYEGGGGTGVTSRNIQIQVRSSADLESLAPIAAQIEEVVKQVPGTADVGSSFTNGQPEIQFDVDKTRVRDLGINTASIASTVRALINGNTATSLRQNGDDISVVVQLPKDQRASLDSIRDISIPAASGSVPLETVATVRYANSPTSISRSALQNQITIGANVAEGGVATKVQQDIQAAIAKVQIPSNVTVTYGGDQEDLAEGFSGLFIAMGLAVLFVYMVLASQFGSFSQPLIIMLAMPFSFLGAFIGLRLFGQPLDITGMIGLIMLLGLVTKNSILLVDFTNHLRQSGYAKHEAIARAGAVRLRPILMTSLAIVAGALPTALGIHFFSGGSGSEFRRGLAVVLIGGMVTSTLLTLLVVPIAYSLLDSIQVRMGRLFSRRARAAAAAPQAAD
ncbi:efflux RND transporter permease subunit [Chloroflexia bacterium SDU3-3]|nr:efflux RND transporter permease subunit [Chloroflexia bacterium SDU3-3]